MQSNVPRGPICALWLLLITCLLATTTAQAQSATGLAARIGELRAKAKSEGVVRIIAKVSGQAGSTAMRSSRGAVVAAARRLGATGVKESRRRPTVAMTVSESALEALVASGQIIDVEENLLHAPALDSTLPVIGGDVTLASGLRGGAGRVIVILDTGVDNDHANLNVVSESCFSTNDTNATSLCPGAVAESQAEDSAQACSYAAAGVVGCNHGTRVAGVAAGDTGVAPEADIIAVQVFSKYTNLVANNPCKNAGAGATCLLATSNDILEAFEWISEELTGDFNIAAVNLSVGNAGDQTGSCNSGDLPTVITDLYDVGIATVIASGNGGTNNGLGSPACITLAIVVGATNDADAVASFSNTGAMMDVWAPGVSVVTTDAGGGFTPAPGVDGTSFSAPHVAGAIAMLRDIDGEISVADSLMLLANTGVSVTDTRVGGSITAPRINLLAAATELSRQFTSPEASNAFGSHLSAGDFNGDGRADLVAYANESLSGATGAGVAEVYYGTNTGPGIVNVWHEDADGITGSPSTGDNFGENTAVGNFNGDAFDDLAIGVEGESVSGNVAAGAVHVLYGSATGLTSTNSQYFTQDTGSVEDAAEAGDEFGARLAAGDFNGDGRDDLVIAAVHESIGTVANAGAVHIIYGSASGLSATTIADQLWSQDTTNVEDAAETGDVFGARLAVGRFNNDTRDDLAIGVPGESVGVATAAGAVNVIYGSASGLSATSVADQLWTQDSTLILDSSEASDAFGQALTAADFNNDGRTDLAIGVPNESVGAVATAGAVNVIYGAASGLSTTSNQFWTQDSANIESTSQSSDLFGFATEAGRLNNDNYADLAIGVPGESGGAVAVIYGSASGLSATSVADQLWSQDSTNIAESSETGDQFGFSIALGDYNGDGRLDLAASAPFEDLGAQTDAGFINVIFQASTGGLSSTDNQGLSE
jgi:hypothetical protein